MASNAANKPVGFVESHHESKPGRPGMVVIELNKTTWEVPQRYTIQNAVGIGAYGQVW